MFSTVICDSLDIVRNRQHKTFFAAMEKGLIEVGKDWSRNRNWTGKEELIKDI